jgi:hypothetical protein
MAFPPWQMIDYTAMYIVKSGPLHRSKLGIKKEALKDKVNRSAFKIDKCFLNSLCRR